MELQTISTVSKEHGISTRMLRYYEQNGLIKSMRKDGYSYRVYDDANLKRLQQVIILRKLQIPVKQICIILNNPDATTVVEIFKKSIQGLDLEITALSTIKIILDKFVNELEGLVGIGLDLDFIGGDSVLELSRSLSLVQKNIKESVTMNDLLKAADVLNKLENVRVVYVPPMTVASVYETGENAEEKAWKSAVDFVVANNLVQAKPDLRVFKIAHQNATGNSFGDEVWVSVPDNITIPHGFTKKRFLGGQYAAHVLDDNGFEVALGLQDWINESDKFQYDFDGNLSRCEPPMSELDSFGGMHLDLSEVLNFVNFQKPGFESQIDFLTPIKDYVKSEEVLEEIPGSKEKCGFKASIITKNKYKILGFTQIMSGDATVDGFINEAKHDGRMGLLSKLKKPGAPILGFGSHDMDSQIRGGWRYTICLAESDIADIEGLMRHNPYVEGIDASRWLVFEYAKGDTFDDHAVAPKLGHTWNGVISGSFATIPNEDENVINCWYPIK
ncbi:MAG: MerR family transcriptional regulator [Defluviitaleaceae bacterium]|nr:MerR family transcriptional regulator [Defluviitaleaceae bacterium]